jgi:coenzyme F420-reducing hydrogenase beta subunit
MNKKELLRKLEAILNDVESCRVWGQIEIEFQNGVAVRVRKSQTEKLEKSSSGEQLHAYKEK